MRLTLRQSGVTLRPPNLNGAPLMRDTTRLTLRLPADVAATATALAERQGVSLNAYLALAVGAANAREFRRAMAPFRPVRSVMRHEAPSMGVTPSAPDVAEPEPEGPPVYSKVGANQPCPCGSGEKYKRCHGRR